MKRNSSLNSPISGSAMSRRNMLVAGSLAMAGASFSTRALAGVFTGKKLIDDTDILNFALNLEYLEAEFYSYATTGHGIDPSLFTGTGTQGDTTGGKKVVFGNGKFEHIASEIATDELHHVMLLRSVLGTSAVAKPAINLNALGFGFQGPSDFLLLARAFEDVGVSAYGGAAQYINDAGILEAAARILATEAYHAGNIRDEIAKPKPGLAVDSLDQPPTTTNYFPTDNNGLAVVRTTDEVLMIVRGTSADGGNFFPDGLNGNIR